MVEEDEHEQETVRVSGRLSTEVTVAARGLSRGYHANRDGQTIKRQEEMLFVRGESMHSGESLAPFPHAMTKGNGTLCRRFSCFDLSTSIIMPEIQVVNARRVATLS